MRDDDASSSLFTLSIELEVPRDAGEDGDLSVWLLSTFGDPNEAGMSSGYTDGEGGSGVKPELLVKGCVANGLNESSKGE